jgi:nucleotide-binding universal stress UspA family protein
VIEVKGPPRKILLATDLSARCDRALDRAAMLAKTWQAQLIVVHAIARASDPQWSDVERRLPSWRRPQDPARIAEEQVRRDILQAAPDVKAVVEPGEPSEVILRAAKQFECDLIVTGLARDETLGRFGLGSAVTDLLGRAEVPLLIVKQRARSPYRSVVVASDFSEPSRSALLVAAAFFADQRLCIFHAYDPPSSRMLGDLARYQDDHCARALAEYKSFVAASDVLAKRSHDFDPLIECGYPRELIHMYVRDREADLVVLGTHGRGGVIDALLGSTAKDILFALPCDALVVRRGKSRKAD